MLCLFCVFWLSWHFFDNAYIKRVRVKVTVTVVVVITEVAITSVVNLKEDEKCREMTGSSTRRFNLKIY